jgi:hypothetical protein
MTNLQLISVEELLPALEALIERKVESSLRRDLQEKLLSIGETCKLFQPAITRPTLEKLTREGVLQKHYIGDKPVYKYSEVIQAVRTYEKYKR